MVINKMTSVSIYWNIGEDAGSSDGRGPLENEISNSGNDVWGGVVAPSPTIVCFLICICGTCHIWKALAFYLETNINFMVVSQ